MNPALPASSIKCFAPICPIPGTIVKAILNMAFKTPLKSGDEFVSKLYMKKEGIKYVFYQDIFRKSDHS